MCKVQQFTKLREVLDYEDALVFVGAGVSMWSGLPSWSQLISELADFIEENGASASAVRKELSNHDLLLAASYGFPLLSKSQMAQFIRKSCRVGVAQPHEIHRKLVGLGPSCFITTNYDTLLEDSVLRWKPSQKFKVVTNRQVTETADIIQARAQDFIFKPHGDVGDIDSIILTREHYRSLIGEKRQVHEALKTLLSSRPIFYIGFGLKDPDFLLVKDILANTYRSGTRDHYAICANVSEGEKPYWRDNYGIHLISYETSQKANGGSDHTQLIQILDKLSARELRTGSISQSVHSIPGQAGGQQKSGLASVELLSLARYANHLNGLPKVSVEIPLRVRPADNEGRMRGDIYHLDRFGGCSIGDFLMNGPKRALVVGPPGAGKTYAIRSCVEVLGKQLQDACLAESPRKQPFVVPFYLDMRLYSGSLWDMAERALPPGLSMELLTNYVEYRFYIDALNETPREHIENGSFEKDFASFLGRVGQSIVIVGSRTREGVSAEEFTAYNLDEIDRDFVEAEVQKRDVVIGKHFRSEIISLLQKPFVFQLFVDGAIALSRSASPQRVYRSYFETLSRECVKKFDIAVNLETALAPIAYYAIDTGHEAIPLKNVLESLKEELVQCGDAAPNETDVLNWLIARSFFVPQSGSRLTLFHQSVTEYLAAFRLASVYQTAKSVLRDKLRFTRWDQALFLTLGFLNEKDSNAFVEEVLRVDFALGIRASKYLEVGRVALVTRILKALVKRRFGGYRAESAITSVLVTQLPVAGIHSNLLWKLVRRKGQIGGAAGTALCRVNGNASKKKLLDALFANAKDYNFCAALGAGLTQLANKRDPAIIAKRLLRIRCPKRTFTIDDPLYPGLCSGLSNMLSQLDPKCVDRAFRGVTKHPLISQTLCEFLYESKSPEALRIAAGLILDGIAEAHFTVLLILRYSEDALPLEVFTAEHINALLGYLGNERLGPWSGRAIREICRVRPDLATTVRARLWSASGAEKACLASLLPVEDHSHLWDALNELCAMDAAKLNRGSVYLHHLEDVSWIKHEDLLIRLLKRRSATIAESLLEPLYSRLESDGPNAELSLDIGPVIWWLEWMKELDSAEKNAWVCDRISNLFGWGIPRSKQFEFIGEFNKSDSPFRKVLAKWLLRYFPNVSTSDLSESAIEFLLADLRKNRTDPDFNGNLLGNIAPESFVTTSLLPLLSTAQGVFRRNVIAVLKTAGERHRTRYVTDES